MKVLKKDVYKGFTFICNSYNENKTISSLYEKNVYIIKLKNGSFVNLEHLLANNGRFREIIPFVPHYNSSPSRAGEIYIDERCLQQVYKSADETEKIDVADIKETESTQQL